MGNLLSKVGDNFKMKMKLVTGQQFYGQFLEIPDTSRVSNFLSARRYLRTNVNTIVKPKDVMIADGVKYIVAEHGTGFYQEPIYKHFKLFQVDTELANYKQQVKTKNPITGVWETGRENSTVKVYLSMQPRGLIEDSLDIQQQIYTAVSNVQLQRNDIVNDLVVTKVDHVLGVYLLELKEK